MSMQDLVPDQSNSKYSSVNEPRGISMLVTYYGKSDHISKQETSEVVRFFADILLSKKMQNNLKIRVSFNKRNTKGLYGYAAWKKNNLRPRNFTLALDPDNTREEMLITIAHEMVHIEQYASGKLKEYVRSGNIHWMGKAHPDCKMVKNTSPWERDARRKEKLLYIKYVEHLLLTNDNTI